MIDIRLDTAASALNFIAGIILAIDALTANWKTRVTRGWKRFFEGARKLDNQGLVSDASGERSTSRSAEDWADKRTRRLAFVGFCLLSLGFALDIFSKAAKNLLLFSSK